MIKTSRGEPTDSPLDMLRYVLHRQPAVVSISLPEPHRMVIANLLNRELGHGFLGYSLSALVYPSPHISPNIPTSIASCCMSSDWPDVSIGHSHVVPSAPVPCQRT